jgi:hypothetical protein
LKQTVIADKHAAVGTKTNFGHRCGYHARPLNGRNHFKRILAMRRIEKGTDTRCERNNRPSPFNRPDLPGYRSVFGMSKKFICPLNGHGNRYLLTIDHG